MFGIRRITDEFFVCTEISDEYDLTLGDRYRLVEDPKAARIGCIRVIDDSGCSALHPAALFRPVEPGEERA